MKDRRGAFDEVAQWSAVGGGEGPRAGGVRLADPGGGVDLVGEHDQAAEIAGLAARGDLDCCQQVGRPVRAGGGGIAHGTGDDNGLRQVMQQIEQIGGFLDRVGALNDDAPGRASQQSGMYSSGELGEVLEGQTGARLAAERDNVESEARVGQARYGIEKLPRGQCGRDATAGAGGHGDGAAEPKDDQLSRWCG